MAAKLIVQYDSIGDILHIDTVRPYRTQGSNGLGEDVIIRTNPKTGAIENIEILFFTERTRKGETLALPVVAQLKRSVRSKSRVRNGVRTRQSRKR
jgi:hypothetical protein